MGFSALTGDRAGLLIESVMVSVSVPVPGRMTSHVLPLLVEQAEPLPPLTASMYGAVLTFQYGLCRKPICSRSGCIGPDRQCHWQSC